MGMYLSNVYNKSGTTLDNLETNNLKPERVEAGSLDLQIFDREKRASRGSHRGFNPFLIFSLHR
jgi:hypothetical protein